MMMLDTSWVVAKKVYGWVREIEEGQQQQQ